MSLRAQRGNRELCRLDYICGAKLNNSSYVIASAAWQSRTIQGGFYTCGADALVKMNNR